MTTTTDPNSLHDALVELATTMSPNPERVRQVRQRVARRRRRRMATGAAVSVGAVAGAVGLAMIPREPNPSAQFSATASPLPACASVPTPAPSLVAPQKTPVTAQPGETDTVIRYKGAGVVTEVDAGTLTLGGFSEPGMLPTAGSIVVIVDAATTFQNNGATATASDVAVGQRVAFAVSIGADGRDHLEFLDLGVESASAAANKSGEPSDAIKGTVEPAVSKDDVASDGTVMGKGVIDAAPQNNQLAVSEYLGAGELRPLQLTLGAATRYFRFDTECSTGEFVAGAAVMFVAVRNDDGTYTATELHFAE